MGVFVVFELFITSLDQVQVALRPDGEPGMEPVVKWLGNGIQPDHVPVKRRTPLEIGNVQRDMVELRFLLRRQFLHPERQEGKNDDTDPNHSRKLSDFRFA
jgi:hypothetical protein